MVYNSVTHIIKKTSWTVAYKTEWAYCFDIYTVIQGNDTESLWTDPMFVDLKNGDYTLKSESPALGMGFNQIILDNFGVQEEVKYLKSLRNNGT